MVKVSEVDGTFSIFVSLATKVTEAIHKNDRKGGVSGIASMYVQ